MFHNRTALYWTHMTSGCWALFPEWSPYFSKSCPRPSGLPLLLQLLLQFWLLFPLNSPGNMSCCFPGRRIFPHFPAQFHLCISYSIFAYHQIPSSLFCRRSSPAHTSLLLCVVNELSFPTCFRLLRLCLWLYIAKRHFAAALCYATKAGAAAPLTPWRRRPLVITMVY